MQVERRKSDIGCQKSDIIIAMNADNLEVYKKASALFPKIYRIVRSWKQIDQREIGSQMIRSANSIHANIAEGISKTPQDFKRYISNAIGSCDELISHIKDCANVELISIDKRDNLLQEYTVIAKQLTRLKQHWK
ncbi:MAG: hypothetical protein A2928_02630 [Candidatus Taylorbacteria bacterium RIFCSPLOWO2_01_FULL_45_15b]|uniref:Four helix bundle protein n=1 Tax=Candidatus Taylorbacteria bacterium RIFCSPLOWO2_01_FULL_45_15b TaxID=1802319 RepID=A0A1G2ND68_9BACT|nr:MAG: hypothetical protein A2928_02630 [Candidatus Taylorbacteria bacterium RIFCSPLOWO2_01_FULL_45_15b]